MKIRTYLLLIAVTLLTACAQLGTPPIDTFNKKLLAGYATVETVAKSATALRTAGKLSDADKANVVASNSAALSGLDLSAQVFKTDPGAGLDKLTATLTVLQALQAYLATQGAK